MGQEKPPAHLCVLQISSLQIVRLGIVGFDSFNMIIISLSYNIEATTIKDTLILFVQKQYIYHVFFSTV